MTSHWIVLVMLAAGCSEIIEVPIASPSGTQGTSSGTDEPTTAATSTADSRGSGSSTLDLDDASTSAGPSGTTTGAETLESFTTCSRAGSGLRIPEDGTWGALAVEVPARDQVLMVSVSVRIIHPRISELRLRVRAPDGTVVDLLDEPACEGTNVDAVFQDDAAELGNDQCIEAEVAAIAGTVAALGGLDPLARSPAGTWTVETIDLVPEQIGTLDKGCITLITEGT